MKKRIYFLILISIILTQLLCFSQNDTTNDSWRIEPATSTLYTDDLANGVQGVAIGNNFTYTDFELFASSPEQGFRVHNGRIGFNECNYWPQYLSYKSTEFCRGNLEFRTKHGFWSDTTSSVKMVLTADGNLGVNIENPNYNHIIHAVGRDWPTNMCPTTSPLNGLMPSILARGGISFGCIGSDNSGSWIGTYNDTNGNGYLDDVDTTTLGNSSTIGFYMAHPSGCGAPDGKPSVIIDGTLAKRGYMGINTVSPQSHLDVNGTIRANDLKIGNTSQGIIEVYVDPVTNDEYLSIGTEEDVRLIVGTTDPEPYIDGASDPKFIVASSAKIHQNLEVDQNLDVSQHAHKLNGEVFWSTTSDRNLKDFIQKLNNNALEKIAKVNIVTFEYKNAKGKRKMGIIAQEIATIFPESVGTKTIDGKERLTFNPNELFYTAIKALQELIEIVNQNRDDINLINTEVSAQQTQIEDLLNENEEIRNENEELKNKIEILEQQVQDQDSRLNQIEAMLELNEDRAANDIDEIALAANNIDITNEFPALLQNYPNPFFGKTTIIYSLPKNTKSAWVNVYDLKGSIISNFKLAIKPGRAMLSLNERNFKLKAGTYVYNLVIDDLSVASKQMVLIK